MILSTKAKAYLLITINFIFIVFLFFYYSDLHISKKNVKGVIKIPLTSVVGIEIISFVDGANVKLSKNLSDDWMHNLHETVSHANKYAVNDLLFSLENIALKEIFQHDFDFNESVWSINLTNLFEELIEINVFRDMVVIKYHDRIFVSETDSINECLRCIFDKLVDENVLDKNGGDINFVQFMLPNSEFIFSKKNNSWYMDYPFYRFIENKFIKNTLEELSQVHCDNIVQNIELDIPLFTIQYGSADSRDRVEIFKKNKKFYVKKSNIVFGFKDNIPDIYFHLKNVYKKLSSLSVFYGISFDSIEIQNILNQKSVFLQKIEPEDKWQLSFYNEMPLNFVEINSNIVPDIEKIISSLQIQKNLDQTLAKKILIFKSKSNIGEVDFDIYKILDKYFLLHESSGFTFFIPKEFIDILFSLFNDL